MKRWRGFPLRVAVLLFRKINTIWKCDDVGCAMLDVLCIRGVVLECYRNVLVPATKSDWKNVARDAMWYIANPLRRIHLRVVRTLVLVKGRLCSVYSEKKSIVRMYRKHFDSIFAAYEGMNTCCAVSDRTHWTRNESALYHCIQNSKSFRAGEAVSFRLSEISTNVVRNFSWNFRGGGGLFFHN